MQMKYLWSLGQIKRRERELIALQEQIIEELIDFSLIKSIEYFCENHLDKEIKIWVSPSTGSIKCSVRDEGLLWDDDRFAKKCWYLSASNQKSPMPVSSHIPALFHNKGFYTIFINTPGMQVKNIASLLQDPEKTNAWIEKYEILKEKKLLSHSTNTIDIEEKKTGRAQKI